MYNFFESRPRVERAVQFKRVDARELQSVCVFGLREVYAFVYASLGSHFLTKFILINRTARRLVLN